MKNKKLNLDELKIKSFVTDLENGKENTVKGGSGFIACNPTLPPRCSAYCSITECGRCKVGS